jgi:hypothetical protein
MSPRTEGTAAFSRIEAAYQMLSVRISDNFDLQWRGPTFALAAQSFLFGGFLSAMRYPWLQILLATLIAQAGIAAALLMLHVRHAISLDEQLLDRYEERLIGDFPQLRLHNALHGKSRSSAILGPDWKPSPFTAWIVGLNSAVLWITILLFFSLVGIGLLLWAATRL